MDVYIAMGVRWGFQDGCVHSYECTLGVKDGCVYIAMTNK